MRWSFYMSTSHIVRVLEFKLITDIIFKQAKMQLKKELRFLYIKDLEAVIFWPFRIQLFLMCHAYEFASASSLLKFLLSVPALEKINRFRFRLRFQLIFLNASAYKFYRFQLLFPHLL